MRSPKPIDDAHGRARLDQPPTPGPHAVPEPTPDIEGDLDATHDHPGPGLELETGAGPEPGSRPRWLTPEPEDSVPEPTAGGLWGGEEGGEGERRMSGRARAWAALIAVTAVVIGAVVAARADDTARQPPRGTAIPVSAASTTPPGEGACTGLSGTVVTDGPGDRATVAGVIAAFQAAYYLTRDPDAAMGLVAPEAGITRDGLAAGIASVPVGARHCVAVTPISASTANVHVVQLNPDGLRVDYLQLVNTRPGEGTALLISNVQSQG
ncbi:hypothetical protein [Nocardia bovistercoris]|uniref:DUF8176 domain-containing protein n=1 Tax=Nocardia bovistercoris TaxID=2785916 RepID=A0A931N3B2_9NOCA|nr:hypothetical protein [Nocardia bovistercoris]MBH0777694.1 hypothetical protein [Nocardia bovistercoris]